MSLHQSLRANYQADKGTGYLLILWLQFFDSFIKNYKFFFFFATLKTTIFMDAKGDSGLLFQKLRRAVCGCPVEYACKVID